MRTHNSPLPFSLCLSEYTREIWTIAAREQRPDTRRTSSTTLTAVWRSPLSAAIYVTRVDDFPTQRDTTSSFSFEKGGDQKDKKVTYVVAQEGEEAEGLY